MCEGPCRGLAMKKPNRSWAWIQVSIFKDTRFGELRRFSNSREVLRGVPGGVFLGKTPLNVRGSALHQLENRYKLEAQIRNMDAVTHVRGEVKGNSGRVRQPAAGPIVDLMLRPSQRRKGEEGQPGGCGRAIGFRRNVQLLLTVRRVDSPYAYTGHSTS